MFSDTGRLGKFRQLGKVTELAYHKALANMNHND